MQDAGIAILESFDADIHDNTFSNVNYGIRISLGGGNNMVHDNVFDECSTCEFFAVDSCDIGGVKVGVTRALLISSVLWIPSNVPGYHPFSLCLYLSGLGSLFADGLYTYQGSDDPEASSDGRPGENSFYDNTISNTETGVKIKEADNTVITGKM